jgi:PAS domain S-box-containing protein
MDVVRRISRGVFRTPEIPEKMTEHCKNEITEMNRKRLRYLIPPVIFGISAILSVYLYNAFRSDLDTLSAEYIAADSIFVVFLVICLILRRRRWLDSNKRFGVFLYFVIFVTLLWAAVLSLLDQQGYNSMTCYIMAVLILSVAFAVKPRVFFCIQLTVFIPLMVALPFFRSSGTILLGDYINTIFCSFLSVFISRFLYSSTIEGIVNRGIIESESRTTRETLERFETLWRNVECGITVIDAETREIININPVAARMFGRKKEDIIGRRCHKFLCPADECACPIMDKNQVIDRSERRFINADGVAIPIIKSVAKITLNGRLMLLESFTDISPLKEAEEKLRFMHITEQANQAKTVFLSYMSHEMRTPMNAIVGMTAIGKSANDMERKDYALNKIGDASTHLLGIINDVLDLSKIEAGKFELSPEEFSFEKTLHRAVDVISFRLDEKKQHFNLYIDTDIPPVLIGDDQRLAQIITNLLGNAVKFTPNEGAVSLNARLLHEENDLCDIRIEVVDSGIGISPEQQSRLFHSFEQAEASTSRNYGGTGLGLSISKSIVEMMGGQIWVESELGKGATFAFTVQLKRGDSDKYEHIIREVNWKNIRVLAVDDDNGISGYIKSFVEGYGAKCDTAVCGGDALELVSANGPYDICFIDWKMADMNGLYLAGQLKAIEPDRNKTVAIMVTSIDWGDIEESARDAGVDRFLPKPLFPSAIAEIINDFLGVVGQQVDEAAENSPVVFRGKHILLAEDVEINREIVQALLQPTGLEIDCAENGIEAVRMFRETPERYDLIFMDVQMPEMDGYEATRRIRVLDIPKAKTIPIVAMSASVFREDIEKARASGMNSHIGKPLDIGMVMTALRTYLN